MKTHGEWRYSSMLQTLYSRYPLGRRLNAFLSQSGCSGKEKNAPSLPLPGIKPQLSSL